MSGTATTSLLGLTAQIVSAHVVKNNVATDALSALIQSTYQALAGLGEGQSPAEEERPTPAVPIKRSVFPDYIVCLEDGKKLKMLKRHLKSAYEMTPDQYRERWGLPHDYPMVAPNYTERRSVLARQIGLGRKKEEHAPVAEKPKAKPGRRASAKAA